MINKNSFDSRESFLAAHVRGEPLDDGLLDVKNALLDGLVLNGLDLSGINFTGSVMTNMSLQNTNLSQSDLIDVDLTLSDLTGSKLEGADLKGATANYTNFSKCDLDHTSMDLDSYHEARFTDVNILGTYFKDEFMVFYNRFDHEAFKDAVIHYCYSDKEPDIESLINQF